MAAAAPEVVIQLGEDEEPKMKNVDLSNVGFLKRESTLINCPACDRESMSLIRLEAVTFWQHFSNITNFCKLWKEQYDFNHYCGHCGCYIGRFIPITCLGRWASQVARSNLPFTIDHDDEETKRT